MPEYVYALHDFHPEHEDEISFLAGQPIEVIEKDDQYSDGWWQGRNLVGKIGLFPKSYTTPAAPAPPDTVLQPESITDPSVFVSQTLNEVDPSINGDDSESRIGVALGEPLGHQEEVMEATMTDVQKAIEQLGQNDRDGARSFSFASTRYGDTDRETDTETDGGTSLQEGEENGEDWHRSARDKLAEQARKVVEAKEPTTAVVIPQRTLAPPIELEMSDESEAEYDDDIFDRLHNMGPFSRDHPHIPEENEEDGENDAGGRGRKESSACSSAILPLEVLPSHVPRDGEQTATADQTTFPITSNPVSASHERSASESRLAPVPPMANTFAPAPVVPFDPCSILLPVSPEPTVQVTPVPEIREVSNATSSTPHTVSQSLTSSHNSIASTGQASATSTSKLQASSESARISSPPIKPSPSEWTVEEVVEWLKCKGFGQDVCDKFIEQEITGDVLLELDINLLKAEIGIVAFGKRMRIANAISELRRPPSIIFPDNQSPQHLQSLSHSRSQSYSYTHSHSGSTHQSLNSPIFTSTMSGTATAPSSATFGSMVGPESPVADGRHIVPKRLSSLSSGISISGSLENPASAGVAGSAGLGFSPLNGKEHKGMGSGQLAPSPSDSALNKRSQSTSELIEVQDDDRSALSEGGNGPSATKNRRHLLGRSTGSSSTVKDETPSNNNSSIALSTSALVTASPRSPRREPLDNSSLTSRQSTKSRNKRGVDGVTKGTERHSLFGGTFSTSLGKGRKPPPRITPLAIDENSTEKSSTLSLSRLYGGRKTSARPPTLDGSANSLRNFSYSDPSDEKKKSKENMSDYRESVTEKELSMPPKIRADGPSTFQPGQSIIDQIGTPDHQGWMRKKGDHYNSWKIRYFIIKGPHFYILRSDNKAENKIKGYINIVGYKVIADENIDPGRYGFRIVHETEKTHFFSSDEQSIVREWMKAIMKATIGRDYSRPVISSVNIPTIPLTVAQAMNPAPRPPSPSARDATQKALRRENPNQLSSRDARVLMGLPSPDANEMQDRERQRADSFFTHQTILDQQGDLPSATSAVNEAPPRPTREARANVPVPKASDTGLIEWANSHLAIPLRIHDSTGQLYTGLALLRLAESVVGKPASPTVPDSAFPSGPNDDKLDGLFRLFDFLLDNDVKMGSVSINDVRQGKRDKIIQLLKALKAWEDKRKDILRSIGVGSVQAGPFMAPAVTSWKK